MIEASIDEFGYLKPIVWNESTGNLVGGHQRLKTMDMQLTKITQTNLSVLLKQVSYMSMTRRFKNKKIQKLNSVSLEMMLLKLMKKWKMEKT